MKKIKTAADLDWSKVAFFVPEEFSDPHHEGSWKFMSAKTVLKLAWLRKNSGWPILTHNKHGLRGCACMEPTGHSKNSAHYVKNGAHAVDFHFVTTASIREQVYEVLQSGFTGIGLYYDWLWPGRDGLYQLPVGFHVDNRGKEKLQIWKRENKSYTFLLK